MGVQPNGVETITPSSSSGFRTSFLRPFDRVPDGASPFFFRVEADKKGELLEWLRRRGIDALDLWSVAHPLLPSGFPRVRALRTRVVGLPVHQELRRHDLERVGETVLAWRTSTQRSAGLVLLGRTVRDAIEEGAMEYDLLAGGDAYKRRFETGLREARTLVVTPRFHPARAAAAVGVGARRLARRLLVTRP
jgi:hypothetical protein